MLDRRRIRRSINARIRITLRDFLAALDRLRHRENHDERVAKLHRADPTCGDYKHRVNGKRPVAARFRYSDDPRARSRRRHTPPRPAPDVKTRQQRGRFRQ